MFVVVQTNTGELFAVRPSGRTREIDLGSGDVASGDGVLVDGQVAYVVQNFLNQVAKVRLSEDLSSGRVVSTTEAIRTSTSRRRSTTMGARSTHRERAVYHDARARHAVLDRPDPEALNETSGRLAWVISESISGTIKAMVPLASRPTSMWCPTPHRLTSSGSRRRSGKHARAWTSSDPGGVSFAHDAESLASVAVWNLVTGHGRLHITFERSRAGRRSHRWSALRDPRPGAPGGQA